MALDFWKLCEQTSVVGGKVLIYSHGGSISQQPYCYEPKSWIRDILKSLKRPEFCVWDKLQSRQ